MVWSCRCGRTTPLPPKKAAIATAVHPAFVWGTGWRRRRPVHRTRPTAKPHHARVERSKESASRERASSPGVPATLGGAYDLRSRVEHRVTSPGTESPDKAHL